MLPVFKHWIGSTEDLDTQSALRFIAAEPAYPLPTVLSGFECREFPYEEEVIGTIVQAKGWFKKYLNAASTQPYVK